jgi:hypothetical protein
MLKRNSGVKVGRESGWWLLLYSLLVLGSGWPGCWTAHGQEKGPIANPIYDQPLPNTLPPTNIKGEKIDGVYVVQVTTVEVDSAGLKDSKFDWSKLMPELAAAPKSANDILKRFSQSNESNTTVQITETNRLMEVFDAIAEHGEAKYRNRKVQIVSTEGLPGKIVTGVEIPISFIEPDGTKTIQFDLNGISLECRVVNRVAKSGNQSMILELRGQFSGDSKFKHPDGRPVNQVHRINTVRQVKPNQTYALLLSVPSPIAPEELEREIVFFVSVQELSKQE